MKQLALIAAFLAAGSIDAAVVPGFAQSSASSMLDASSMLSSLSDCTLSSSDLQPSSSADSASSSMLQEQMNGYLVGNDGLLDDHKAGRQA